MRDSADDEPWSSDDLTWRGHTPHVVAERMSQMRSELGRRESPAFERLRNYLRVPSDIPARVVVEIADMHRARCFADSQSFRQCRGAVLWSELHWLGETTLIDAFTLMWTPKHYRWWRTRPLITHPSAGPTLWMQVLSKTVDVVTVLGIVAGAEAPRASAFLHTLETALPDLDIVASSGQQTHQRAPSTPHTSR